MRVVAHVLCKIDDHRLLQEQMDESEALKEIVHAYNQIAMRPSVSDSSPQLYVVTGETYGSDFKQLLAYLTPKDKWRLLDRYLGHFPHSAEGDAKTERTPSYVLHHPVHETEEQKDLRKLKHFFIKFGLIVLFLLVVLVLAAGVSVMQTKHLLPDNVVFKTIFDTATELAKILFTMK